MPRRGRLALLAAALAALTAGCATPFDNEPLNAADNPAFQRWASTPREVVGTDVVALSLSGGGLRASAFGFGVVQALTAVPVPGTPEGVDLFDDLSFISAVSGGSLTGAYVALHGRAGLGTFRQQVLARNFEAELRLSLWSPVNLARLLAGGVNDRSNLGAVLDDDVFRGATFADLHRAGKPDVWINATDLFNRTPFPFVPPVFQGLCSDLSQLRVSEAVAASMAVPLAFAPVVLRTWPEHCLTPPPPWLDRATQETGGASTSLMTATARAVRNYRDPQRMRYVKLVDGGLSDNQGLASILIGRAVSPNPHGPFTASDAVRMRRMLFLIVDAGRPPSGDWARQREGPGGVEVGIAAADAAVDSATRLSAAAFRTMLHEWRESIVRWRCSLGAEEVRALLPAGQDAASWRCDALQFELDVVGFEGLPAEQAQRMRTMPTRLALPAADIDAAIRAGRDAAWGSFALREFARVRGSSAVGPARTERAAP